MEKWTIKPTPTTQDPRRHVLLLKGTMKDVTVLLRKFGAMCGRPSPASDPEGYNFALFLHGLTQGSMDQVKAALAELGGTAVPGPTAAAPTAAPELERFPAAPPVLPPPVLPPPVLPPAVLPPPPAIEPPPVPAPALINLSAEPPPVLPPPVLPPPMPALAPVPEPPPIPAPAPAPVAAPAPIPAPVAAAAPPPPVGDEPLFGLRTPLSATLTFESLAVGAYNRFAHAAATSVISSPGSMYNPLFLYGPAGVGKSHMAQAIAHGLGGPLGKDNVILTSGARLGRSVSTAVFTQKFPEIDAVLSKAKALVVDDLHLLSVTDQNTATLAKVFGMFFNSNLQVVLTSMYPPRALGALEEALKISFGKGWSVDLKVPNPNVQREIVHGQLDRAGLNMNNDEVGGFLEKLGNDYGLATLWTRRLVQMHRISQQSGQNSRPDELMAIIFNPDPQASGQEMPGAQQLDSVKGFNPPAAGPNAISLVLVIPKTQEHLKDWILARFYQAGAQYRINQTYKHVAFESYDAQQPFGVPFLIADICQRSGARAAIVIGPPAETQLAARLGEFSHAVGHLLESMNVRMAWVPHNGTMSTANFLRAQLDCLGDQ